MHKDYYKMSEKNLGQHIGEYTLQPWFIWTPKYQLTNQIQITASTVCANT